MIENTIFRSMIDAPVREFRARVEFYEGSELALMCGCHDALKNFTVERVGEEGKFYGYGICQKINVHLVDVERAINLSTNNTAEVVFGTGSNYIYPYPNFRISEVHRDENTNELSITAYDALYKAAQHTVSELTLPSYYTIRELAQACAAFLGLPLNDNDIDEAFNTLYESGANFDGSETIREALNAIAEATQTIYFINWDWKLTFKRLDISGAAALTIDREKYFTLESGDNRRLAKIVHATELGDNVSAELTASGSTQYVRDNPLWELREDIGELVENALQRAGGLTINQFNCSWRGDFLLEIGDKIDLVTKDGGTVSAYVLNDAVSFNGSLSEQTQWSYTDNEAEDEDNPANIGDALKKTYARVDKVNKRIDLVASDVGSNKEQLAALQISANNIVASVQEVQKETTEALNGVNSDMNELTKKVEATMTAEDVKLEIKSELSNGVEKVETSTGFTFNDQGLTVSKTDSEMSTQITEDGMKVYRDGEEVLTANNVGVNAVNLHATTYLIVGGYSRFENFGSDRTGCFWIGG